MDIHDIAFRFDATGKSYAATMLRYAVLQPVFGRLKTERQVHAAFKQAVERWRRQLVRLQDAGLGISNTKLVLARNCPPPGNGGDNNLQPCKLRTCPFCYTRQLLIIRERLRHAWACVPDAAMRFVTYTLRIDAADRYAEQIHTDDTFTCWRSIRGIIDTHNQVRERICERVFPQAYGTACMVSIVPHAFKESPGAVVGYAAVRHRCLGLIPATAVPDTPVKGELFDRSKLTQRQLMAILPRMFTYPVEWLSADPELMVEFIAAARKRRFFIRAGVLRGTKK